MNNKEIVLIIIKTFGLYFLLEAIISLKEVIFYATALKVYNGDNVDAYFYLTQSTVDSLFYLFGALILFSKSDSLVNILKIKSTEQIQIGVNKSDLIEIVVIAVGLYVLISAIPELLNKLTQFLYFNEYEDKEDRYLFWNKKERMAALVYSLFKIAAGFLTVINGRLIAIRLTKIGVKDENIAN